MSAEHYVCRVGADQRGRRLDQFLSQALAGRLEGISRRKVRRLIDDGAVYVDGQRVRVASRKVRPPARVELVLENAPPSHAPRRHIPSSPIPSSPELEPSSILYEDDDVIALDKPSGMASQATRSSAVDDAVAHLRRFLTERDGRPPYLALHHRLDRETSGVLLLAKRRAANASLAATFSERRARKVYQALVVLQGASLPAEPWTIHGRLSAPRQAGGGRRVEVLTTGGREAETEIRPVRSFGTVAWLEARPRTGRTHQIRVHLAEAGMPVLGDRAYGRAEAPPVEVRRLMLHAGELALEHPVTGEPLAIESSLPEDFQRVLRDLDRCRLKDSHRFKDGRRFEDKRLASGVSKEET